MRWTYANSRPALSLRRWLGRRGVGTPPVAVRTEIPLVWRLAGLALLLSLSLAAAAWIYDAGRRFAGFARDETEQEIVALRLRVASLDQELAALRASSGSSTSALQIERTAQELLARKVKDLETENGRLRQDLAFFESLADAARQDAPLTINRLEVQPDVVPGEYRYRMLAVVQGGKPREFDGSVQLIVTLNGPGGPSKLVLPRPEDPDRQRFRLQFRHFRRVDGTFRVPRDARVVVVEARLIQDGATKASQVLTM